MSSGGMRRTSDSWILLIPGLGDILACRDHGLGEPIYSTDGLVHLALGEYSIFHEHAKKRRADKGV